MHILAPPVLGEADRDKPLSWKTGEIERERGGPDWSDIGSSVLLSHS